MKKLSKIFAVALCLAMVLSMLTMGAAAAEEKSVEFTVESLGLDAYNTEEVAKTVAGVDVAYIQLGSYGDGIQMRDKNGNTSSFWNTAAIPGKITKIEFTYSDTKDVAYSDNKMIVAFGNAAKGTDYSPNLLTVAGQKVYTITPDADYSFFYIEWDTGYSSYWKSIKVYYTENAGTQEPPKDAGDHTAIVTMTSVMAVAAVAMAVLVLGKKKFF